MMIRRLCRLRFPSSPRYYSPIPLHPRPLGAYYDLLLTPPPQTPPVTTPITSPAAAATPQERARVVFGSRLAGPGDSRSPSEKKGQVIAGVYVPPRPVEPDNCCMSGCVNCVLEGFVEELEVWRKATMEAERRLAEREGKRKEGPEKAADVKGTKGGGLWEGFEEIDVGLRVFMENEARMKRRQREREEKERSERRKA